MMMTIGGLPHPETNLELVFVTFERPYNLTITMHLQL